MKTVFLRALEADDKAVVLRAAIHEVTVTEGAQRFEVDVTDFGVVPRSPFAYWVSDGFRNLFESREAFATNGRITRQGLATASDFRWVRVWWERDVRDGDEAFPVPYAKGGAFSPFYSDLPLTIRWGRDGRWIKEWKAEQFRLGVFTANNSKCWNEHLYFRPGLTWPLRSQRGLSVRALPSGVIFGQKGSAAFVPDNTSDQLLAYLAIFNSAPCLGLVQMQMAFGAYDVGVIARTPVPALRNAELVDLAKLARSIWSLKRNLDKSNEISHAYTLPALLLSSGETLRARTADREQQFRAVEAELVRIQSEVDDRCFELYGIKDDRRPTIEGFARGSIVSGDPIGINAGGEAEIPRETDEEEDTEPEKSGSALVAELISWAVGVAFGRFDVRLATGALTLPPDPEPFDALPLWSPAMLTGDDNKPLTNAPPEYPLDFPKNGVLVDDPGHSRDINIALRTVFDTVFTTKADVWWDDIARALDPEDHNLRGWLASTLFEHHLKLHSKSRRKAPIFWQFGLSSGRYSIWVYALRLTRDSFFQIQNDVIAPKIAHEERQLTTLLRGAGASPTAKERKEITAQQGFVEELRSLFEEIKHVAPLWNPMLDDGVLLTMSPLWRLVPQHKLWQKELKNKWDELAAGKHDWAHLAMHLWPERVAPKCWTDRSLAIAHGLEDVFWAEEADGNWKAKSTPSRTVDELIRERSSPAVKSALKILLESPDSTPISRRRGRDREAGVLS
jgi:hypothetical protein